MFTTDTVSAPQAGADALTPARIATALPPAVLEVITKFRTAELTTLGRGGRPVTWPLLPAFDRQSGRFIFMTSIGLPAKAFNIRRDPRVSLLFSDPTGSGLTQPPVVLVQGLATAPDTVITGPDDVDPAAWDAMIGQAQQMLEEQPSMAFYLKNPLTRAIMDWYFMRLPIYVTPTRVLWWRSGDQTHEPEILEVQHVA